MIAGISIACLLAACSGPATDYDVVVVGGGLAGLSAAKSLGAGRHIVLEKEARLGGRVLTVALGDSIHYDLGAVFALDQRYRDVLAVDDKEYTDAEDIGFWYEGRTFTGSDVLSCLEQIDTLGGYDLTGLSGNRNTDPDAIEGQLYDFLNTNIKAVFPAALDQYNHNVRPYAWERYEASHFAGGNHAVVNELLKDYHGEVRLENRVVSVTDLESHVRVISETAYGPDTITAKKAIVAVPATIARQIIQPLNADSREFLEGIRYAGYHTVVLIYEGVPTGPEVAYLMPVNTGFASVVRQLSPGQRYTVFLLYIAEEDFGKFVNEAAMRRMAIALTASIWDVGAAEPVETAVHTWEQAGVIVDDHFLEERNDAARMPSGNIVLAGDYCHLEFGVPYGMVPALESGRRAAKLIKGK